MILQLLWDRFSIEMSVESVATKEQNVIWLSQFKGEVHPDTKLVLKEAEKWEKQVSESLGKNLLNTEKIMTFLMVRSIKHTSWQICDISYEP